VPQGTLIALKLITNIKSKSTHPGDPIRAVVAFPLAIGNHVAIPAGTYVEGVIDKLNARPPRGAAPSVQLRFTRLLFANGYSVPLVATNTQAMIPALLDPRRANENLADARDGAPYLGETFATPGQTNPQPPSLPSVGPSPGVLAGIGIGAGVGILVLTLAIGHHRAGSTDYILFDSGWQFQMAIQEPLTLDGSQVSAAAAIAR
jgi:type IV secretion system protein VirB10